MVSLLAAILSLLNDPYMTKNITNICGGKGAGDGQVWEQKLEESKSTAATRGRQYLRHGEEAPDGRLLVQIRGDERSHAWSQRVQESGLQHHERSAPVELVDEGEEGGEHDEAGGGRERALETEA